MVQFGPKGEPRLVVLDCGIVYASKSDAEHQKLVDICFSFMKHDGRGAGRLMIENVGADPDNAQDFCEGIQAIVTRSEQESYFEHLGEYFMMVCDLAREHFIRLDPGYFKIVMSLKVAEGISLALNRNLDLISTCVPITTKARALRAMGIEKFPTPEDDDGVIIVGHDKHEKDAKKSGRK